VPSLHVLGSTLPFTTTCKCM